MASVHHPPAKNKERKNETLSYLITAISSLSWNYRKANWIITGDFNRLDTLISAGTFDLAQIVKCIPLKKMPASITYTQTLQSVRIPVYTCHQYTGKKSNTNVERSVTSQSLKIKLTGAIAQQDFHEVYAVNSAHDKAEAFHNVMLKTISHVFPLTRSSVRVDKATNNDPLTRKLRRAENRAHKISSK